MIVASELNAEGSRLVEVYIAHNATDRCGCAECRVVRRTGLIAHEIVRPTCCGAEMKWQGDPVLGPIGYECFNCGALQ